METKIQSLRDLISNVGADSIQKELALFSVPLDSEMQDFIQKKSILFENEGFCRTYLDVMYEDDKFSSFLGYFTITHKPLHVPNHSFSESEEKLLFPHHELYQGKLGYDEKNGTFSSFCICEVAKNAETNKQKNYVNFLLQSAMLIIKQANSLIGGRFVYLDYDRKVTTLKKKYAGFGFKDLQENPTNSELCQMYFVI